MQYSSSSENYSTSFKRDSPSKWGDKQDDKDYVYKKSLYQYSSAGKNNASDLDKSFGTNISQLDSLLEDLKNERQTTRDRDLLTSSTNYRAIESDQHDPAGLVTTTTRVVKTSKHSGQNPVMDNFEKFSTSDYSTLKSDAYPSLRSGDYTDKGNVYESKSKIYESNRHVEGSEVVPSRSNATNLQKDLQDLPLSEDILPLPGTKVTTTVRTYTYEVPATSPTGRSQLNTSTTSHFNTLQRNELRSLQPVPDSTPVSAPTIPQTVVYNTESFSTINKNAQPVVSNQMYEIREHKETNTLHNNYRPQEPVPSPMGIPDGTNRTIIYKLNTTENDSGLPDHRYAPDRSPHPAIGEPRGPPYGSGSPPGPTTSRYFYKETSNVVNTIHGPGGSPEQIIPVNLSPTNQTPQKTLPISHSPYRNEYPQNLPHMTSTQYSKYSSSTTSRHGPGHGPGPGPVHVYGVSPTPAPFPVDGVDYPIDSNPPQKVDDLMQSLGNVNVNRNDIETPHRKREIETAVASPNHQHVPTVNKAGREVYYPPGHEIMLTKREEMAAGSAAGGRWAKGSGMYEYESGSRSKTKTKSGGAMVPVCLPLCCAMPCSIM